MSCLKLLNKQSSIRPLRSQYQDLNIMSENKKTPQIVATFAATIGAFSLGTVLGWSSPATPFLVDCNEIDGNYSDTLQNCTLPKSFSAEEGSWISSTVNFGMLFGAIMAGLMLPRFGRKWTMILLNIPTIIGFICLLIPSWTDMETPTMFYVGRIFSGIGGGGFAIAPPVYTSEISETSIRGAMGSVMQFMLTIGLAAVYALGIENAVKWEIITGLCIIPPILSAVAMFFMPESPYYLIGKGKEGEALTSLQWLRGTPNVKDELEDLKQSYLKEANTEVVSFKKLLTDRVYLEPFVIMLILMFLQQFSGINAVLFNLQTIFVNAHSSMDAGLSGFIIGLVQVVATGVAVLVVDKFGRKPLLAFSDITMCISIFALGTYFYLDENKQCALGQTETYNCRLDSNISPETVDNLGILPLVSLIVYIAAFSLGFGPLPWAMNAELFPVEAKVKATPLITAWSWTCSFFVSKFVENITNAIENSGSYFLFGSICALGAIFVITYLPETKGKTNDDMKQFFMKRAGHDVEYQHGIENRNYDDRE